MVFRLLCWSVCTVSLNTVVLSVCALVPSTVFASDHSSPSDQGRTAVKTPPLPFVQPVLGPRLTDGYHQEVDFPTTHEKWIDVDLSEQRVVAYEGTKAVRAFTVSTGLARTPTVQGEFRIQLKVQRQTMSGGSAAYGYYSLPNVQWVQYFYQEYAFHGAYWHDNFGQPMSHGCINMTNDDAKWLFDWAGPIFDENGPTWQRPAKDNPGTLVRVHE